MSWFSKMTPATKHDTERILMKLSELSTALTDVETKIEKAQAEIVKQIADLKAALADVEVPAEATAALEKLTASAQALDDITPDAPTA